MIGTTPLRVALVGCGRMGRAHLAAASAVSEIAVVAIVDPVVTVPSQRSATLHEVVSSNDVDALIVASPTPTHREIVEIALRNYKHVLCEKPLTLDSNADLVLDELARLQKRILHVGFWRRFAEPYLVLRNVLSSGRLGKVRSIRAAQWDAQPPPAAFCNPQVSGGLEIDCGVHEFDLVRWLLHCEIKAIAACSPMPPAAFASVNDVAITHGLAELSNALSMTIDLTRTAGYRDSIRTEVIGDHGSVIVEFDNDGVVIVRDGETREITPIGSDPILGALRGQLRALAEAVRNGKSSRDAAVAADSRRALLAAIALRDARNTGVWRAVEI